MALMKKARHMAGFFFDSNNSAPRRLIVPSQTLLPAENRLAQYANRPIAGIPICLRDL